MERYHYSEQEQAALEGLQQPFAVFQMVDKRIVALVLSDGFCQLLGTEDRAQAYADMDHDTFRNVHPDDAARLGDAVFRFVRDGSPLDTIYRLLRADKPGCHIIHVRGRHVYTETGARLAHVWYMDEGIYEEENSQPGAELTQTLSNALHEQSILNASYYDYLTGLPSMTYFFELAEAGTEAILAAGGCPVILYMDLGGMKFYNTKYGFAEGDKLLRAFSVILARTFSKDSCSHFGADHFVVYTEKEGLEDTLNRLFRECRGMNGGNALPVHVGIYLAQGEKAHVSTACDRAKIACDVIKNAFSSCFNYYDQELQDDTDRRQYILENLDRAIEEKWIQVCYQPIVRAVSGMVSDEEALSRWVDPVKGTLPPAEFIPILEDARVIYKLDLYVLEQILEKIKIMDGEGIAVVPQSINLSRADFDACNMVEEIRRRVDAAGVSRDRITIEITESVIGSDFDFIKEQVRRFRELGFPVWMDDFGSGYSSLDVLQSIRFDLIKFDMGFMRKLDESADGRIILTELMIMASALGIDTVCEGVETESQARFLQEIGCSKLQGFYYGKPTFLQNILAWHLKRKTYPEAANSRMLGFEDAKESPYFAAIGGVNLYDLAVLANEENDAFQNAFNTLPMGIIEVNGAMTRFMRSNQSYRDFIKRFIGLDLSYEGSEFAPYNDSFMYNVVKTCCELGIRSFYDEKMPDGSVVHSFARRIGVNPVNGNIAVAIAVLSVRDPDEGESYADIARALASDYYKIYIADLDTERFIEYSSPIGGQELAMERHGEDFFNAARRDSMTRIFEGDRELFLAAFSKEKIVRELDEQGVFTVTYRLIEGGRPLYANMKITRMQPGGNRIIIGISIIDNQMKESEHIKEIRRERDALARVMTLAENYLSLYAVDPDTGRYVEYGASDEYETLGLPKEGEDFFLHSIVNGKKVVYPDDLPAYLESFTRENIMREIGKNGVFTMRYHLSINGRPEPVTLKIVRFRESSGDKLVAGVRAWKNRGQ